jgi:hypothetical protein
MDAVAGDWRASLGFSLLPIPLLLLALGFAEGTLVEYSRVVALRDNIPRITVVTGVVTRFQPLEPHVSPESFVVAGRTFEYWGSISRHGVTNGPPEHVIHDGDCVRIGVEPPTTTFLGYHLDERIVRLEVARGMSPCG